MTVDTVVFKNRLLQQNNFSLTDLDKVLARYQNTDRGFDTMVFTGAQDNLDALQLSLLIDEFKYNFQHGGVVRDMVFSLPIHFLQSSGLLINDEQQHQLRMAMQTGLQTYFDAANLNGPNYLGFVQLYNQKLTVHVLVWEQTLNPKQSAKLSKSQIELLTSTIDQNLV